MIQKSKCVNCIHRDIKYISKTSFIYGCFGIPGAIDLGFEERQNETAAYFDSKFTMNRKGDCQQYQRSLWNRFILFFKLLGKKVKTPKQI